MRFSVVALGMILAKASFALSTGDMAPDFSVKNSKGETVKLSDYKDRTVVLEWFNYGCPFIKKHYGAGNMQALQKEYTGKGVIWFSVNSSAKGKEGHETAKEAEAHRIEHGSNATAILLDENGKVGKLYGAKTTPHMFLIKKGKLMYQGAIDDKPSADKEDVKIARSYIRAALNEVEADKAVTFPETQPYGCGVKY